MIQSSQNQGLLRQFAVVFFLSVHFLWNRCRHLLQASCWSLGLVAAGFSGSLQELQWKVFDWIWLLIALIAAECSVVWLLARGSRKLVTSQTGEDTPVVITCEPCTWTELEV